MDIQICVGSSCHLKGSSIIIEKMQEAVEKYNLTGKVNLSGSFCMGVCNRLGVTVAVDGEVHTGISPENFSEFFAEHVLAKLNG
jgi:NADH:ubiquinone oxidoreductase subunit E